CSRFEQQASRGHDHLAPGVTYDPHLHHRRRQLGARFIPAVLRHCIRRACQDPCYVVIRR
ncbi:hypothetical protein CERSUDRAFT_136912, partial [Gelatoporia subvermispora B]